MKFLIILALLFSVSANATSDDLWLADAASCGLYLQSKSYTSQTYDLLNKIKAKGISEYKFTEAVKVEMAIARQAGRELYLVTARQSCKEIGIF